MLGIGGRIQNGTGVQSNPEQGSEFAQVACQGGLGAGCTLQAEIQEKLSLWGQGDASLLYEQGCELGDGRACGVLALKRLTIDGFTPEITKALSKDVSRVTCKVVEYLAKRTQTEIWIQLVYVDQSLPWRRQRGMCHRCGWLV